MSKLDDCIKKFGKALSPKDVQAIRDLGGDIAAANKFLGTLKRQVPGRLAQEAKRNEIGLYSLIEHTAATMDLQEWRVKKNAPVVSWNVTFNDDVILSTDDESRAKEEVDRLIEQGEKPASLLIRSVRSEPTAPGVTIWGRLKNLKPVEASFMGLEEFLLQGKTLNWHDATEDQLADVEGTRKSLKQFTRQEVIDFIQANGIQIEMEYGERKGTAQTITWNDGEVDTDPSHWESEANSLVEAPDDWFDFERWVSKNLDNDVFKPTPISKGYGEDQEFTVEPMQDEDGRWGVDPRWMDGVQFPSSTRWASREDAQAAIDGLTFTTFRRWFDEVPGEQDPAVQQMIDDKDWAGLVEHIGKEDLTKAADTEIRDAAYEIAEELYTQNPYKRWTTTNDGVDATIWGNDDIAYRVEVEGQNVDDGTLYDLQEAKDFVQQYFQDHGMTAGTDPDDPHNWSQHVPPVGDHNNYRNQKLFLPQVPASTIRMQEHFPNQPSMVAFNRFVDLLFGNQTELFLIETQSDWDSDARKAGGYTTGADVGELRDNKRLVKGQIDELLDDVFEVDESQLSEELTKEEAFARAGGGRTIHVDRINQNGERGAPMTLARFDDVLLEHEAVAFNEEIERGYTHEFYTDGVSEQKQREEFNELAMEVIVDYTEKVLTNAQMEVFNRLTPELVAELKPLVYEYNALENQIKAESTGIPSMPYKDNKWTELSLKYAINEAIEGGYERFSWSDEASLHTMWSDNYKYKQQYEQRMPTFVRKLTGQQAVHVQLDGSPMPSTDDVDVDTTGWQDIHMLHRLARSVPPGKFVIDITPELIEHFETKKTLMQEGDRGELILNTDGSRLMKLSKASDLSTFLHEAMHLFVETEKQLSATMGVTANNQALMDFVGAESFDDINATTPEGKARHEKLSRAFEAYLREGSAPSLKLRDAFAAFKHWLMSLYKNAAELDVELDDNIRNAFDRMLATEAEIVEQMTTPAYEQKYTQDDHPGMTDAEYEAYELNVQRRKDRASETVTEKLMKEYTARRTKEWKEEREPLVEEHLARLLDTPLYQLITSITELDEKGKSIGKLDRDQVIAAVGELTPRMKGKMIRWGTSDGGQDPIALAEKYGYDSTIDMINEIMAAPTIKKASESAAEQQMIDHHGDILNDGTLAAEITEALHNDTQAAVLLAELKAMKPKRKRLINREFLKAEAKRLIGAMNYKEIQPDRYYRAEIRAAKRSVDATGAELYDAKIAQLTNHYLYREAVATREAMIRHQRYVKAVDKRKYNAKLVDPEYIANMKALAKIYDMWNNPEAQRAELNKFFSWYARMTRKREKDPEFVPIEIKLEDVNLMLAMESWDTQGWSAIQLQEVYGDNPPPPFDTITLPSFDSLTASELKGLYEQLRHLRHVGGADSTLQNQELVADREAMVEALEGKRRVTDPATPGRERKTDAFYAFVNKMPHLKNLIRNLDGFSEDEGVFNRLIYRRIEESSNTKLRLTREMGEQFEEELAGVHKMGLTGPGVSHEIRRKYGITIPSEITLIKDDGEKAVFTPEEIFMVALYWGTDTSREAIRKGHGMTDGDVERLLSKLTDDQLKLVNAIWKINESQWDALSSAQFQKFGSVPEKLDATPFDINGVTMTGGHMRLYYNSAADRIREDQEVGSQFGQIVPGVVGSMHSRIGSGGKPVLLDRNNIIRNLNENIHFIAFAKNSAYISRLLGGREVKKSIIDKMGGGFYTGLVHKISIMTGNQRAYQGESFVASVLRLFRRAAIYRHLVGSARNIVQQTTTLPIAAREVGGEDFIAASTKIMSDRENMLEFIRTKSEFMKNRTKLVNKEIHDQMKQLSIDGPIENVYSKMVAFGFKPQIIIDSLIAFPTWMARYEQGMNSHGDEVLAISDADMAVVETVGSGSDLHLGAAFSSNAPEWTRLLTIFGSWFNSQYQRQYRATKGFNDFKSLEALEAMFIMPMFLAVMSSVLVMDWPGDDEGLFEYVMKRYTAFLGGGYLMIREMASFFASGFGPRTILSGAQEAPVRLINEIDAFLSGRQGMLKTGSDVTKAVTTIVPVPFSGQVTRVADYYDSYNRGKEGDFNLYQALVEGPDRNK